MIGIYVCILLIFIYLAISGLIEDVDQFQEVSWKDEWEGGLKCILRSILYIQDDVNWWRTSSSYCRWLINTRTMKKYYHYSVTFSSQSYVLASANTKPSKKYCISTILLCILDSSCDVHTWFVCLWQKSWDQGYILDPHTPSVSQPNEKHHVITHCDKWQN